MHTKPSHHTQEERSAALVLLQWQWLRLWQGKWPAQSTSCSGLGGCTMKSAWCQEPACLVW